MAMMIQTNESMRERSLEVLHGETPARLPFVTRLETWYKAHRRTQTLPARFSGMTLDEVHQAVGAGRLKFTAPYAYKLVGVHVCATFNGERCYDQDEPVVENFPGMWDVVPVDRAGITRTELVTPVGRLSLTHQLLEQHVQTGTDPYLKEHLIKGEDDYRAVEYILERAEFVPLYAKLETEWAQLGENGLLVPLLQRLPFQQVLLEYLGEEALFYALYDQPGRVQRLIALLDGQLEIAIGRLAELGAPYVEFPDNLDGKMTNPRLFREYCLPMYQKYTGMLHAQGKKVGSHTDGNIRPLLGLLAETGLDVCESFTPSPLTPCSFTEAQQAWQGRPLIWGGIPSVILEETYSEEACAGYVAELLSSIRHPMILGIVDLFMRHNSIERVAAIARQVAAYDWRSQAASVL